LFYFFLRGFFVCIFLLFFGLVGQTHKKKQTPPKRALTSCWLVDLFFFFGWVCFFFLFGVFFLFFFFFSGGLFFFFSRLFLKRGSRNKNTLFAHPFFFLLGSWFFGEVPLKFRAFPHPQDGGFLVFHFLFFFGWVFSPFFRGLCCLIGGRVFFFTPFLNGASLLGKNNPML